MCRLILMLNLLALALWLLAGCSLFEPSPAPDVEGGTAATPEVTDTPQPTETPAPTPTEDVLPKTVRIWHAWDEPYIPALVEIITNFQENNPNIYFDVLYIPRENLLARYMEETRAGGGPSLLFGPAEWGPLLYDQGLIDDLATKFPSDFFTRFNPAALGQMRVDQATIGLPYQIQGVVLMRNQAIIPEAPDSFGDLVNLAKSFTQGETIGAILERSFFFSGGHLEGIGGRIMDDKGEPLFNDSKGIEWVNMLIDFESVGPTSLLSDSDLDLFLENRVGIIVEGTWSIDLITEAIGAENLVIDIWPSYANGFLSGFVQGEDVFLSTQVNEESVEAALMFMEYLSSTESQTILANSGMIPAITDIQLVGDITQRRLTQIIKALEGGVAYPVLPEIDLYNGPLDLALRSVFELGTDPETALEAAEQTILAELERIRATVTPTP